MNEGSSREPESRRIERGILPALLLLQLVPLVPAVFAWIDAPDLENSWAQLFDEQRPGASALFLATYRFWILFPIGMALLSCWACRRRPADRALPTLLASLSLVGGMGLLFLHWRAVFDPMRTLIENLGR